MRGEVERVEAMARDARASGERRGFPRGAGDRDGGADQRAGGGGHVDPYPTSSVCLPEFFPSLYASRERDSLVRPRIWGHFEVPSERPKAVARIFSPPERRKPYARERTEP